jgi:hypothetical protein
MARTGAEATAKNISRPVCREMYFTGRVMKDYVFVTNEGLDNEEDLEYWGSDALAFNLFTKASKKKVKTNLKKQERLLRKISFYSVLFC